MNNTVVIVTNKNMYFYAVVAKAYLYDNYKINARIQYVNKETKQEDLDIEKDEIIVALSFDAMNICYGLKNCLVMSPNQTQYLNDKQSCGEFIDILKVPNIPTFYNRKTHTIIDLQHFCSGFNEGATYCVKDRFNSASRNIHFLRKDDLLNKYKNKPSFFKDSIVQLYIEPDYILAIDCVCEDGKIIAFLVNKAPPFFKKEDKWIKNRFIKFTHDIVTEKCNNMFYTKLVMHTEKIIKSVNYNGFIEIEWICNEKRNQLLFLEINPRMSGNLTYSKLEEASLPYMDVLLVNYIAIIQKSNNNSMNNLVSKIPKNHPKKITKGSLNLIVRPIMILIFFILLVFLITQYKSSLNDD